MQNIIRSLILPLLFHFPATTCGQGNSSSAPSLIHDFRDVSRGIGYVYTSPLRWDTDEWLAVGGVMTAVAGSFFLDDGVRRTMLAGQGAVGDKFDAVGNFYGQARYAAAFSVGMYAAGFVTGDSWLRGTGITLIQTLVSAGALNLALKVVAGRSRPYLNSGNGDFHPFSWKEEFFSLPSGHAVVAFSLSSVLSSRINNTWCTVGLYTLAGVTAWSRLYSDDHWLSDVLLGSAFSTAMGIAATRWYGSREEDSAFTIIPLPTGILVCLRL